MSGASAVGLIAARELRERSRQKSFKLSTTFIALGLLAAVVVPQVLSDRGPTAFDVGGPGPRVRWSPPPWAAPAPPPARSCAWSSCPDRARTSAWSPPRWPRGWRCRPPWSTLECPPAPCPTPFAGRRRRSGASRRPRPEDDAAQPLLFLGVLLLYVSLLTFGVAVATGVVEEKSSRVVEVLLAAVRPPSSWRARCSASGHWASSSWCW
ncbi:MAG TPA: hypothetical protein VK975_00225 [Acidimicrobiales bacterium]|nr:hypothetical protein [Acidimicrobiales bacterium]